MTAIIGSLLFVIVSIITILVAFGLPLGEFTMGEKYKVLPKNLRFMALLSFAIQVFAIFILLQAGGILPLFFSKKIIKYICIFFAIYLSLNTVMNALSTSKKEKYFATPLSIAASICFWMTGLSM